MTPDRKAKRQAYDAARYIKNREKVIARRKARYVANPEKYRAASIAYGKKNRGRQQAYRDANRATLRAGQAAYRKAHPDRCSAARVAWEKANSWKCSAKAAKRRAITLRATPTWANTEAINDVYKEAEYMQMHVDHVVPLSSGIVCGLHVWDNLQLLTGSENSAKGNRFWPDMPDPTQARR